MADREGREGLSVLPLYRHGVERGERGQSIIRDGIGKDRRAEIGLGPRRVVGDEFQCAAREVGGNPREGDVAEDIHGFVRQYFQVFDGIGRAVAVGPFFRIDIVGGGVLLIPDIGVHRAVHGLFGNQSAVCAVNLRLQAVIPLFEKVVRHVHRDLDRPVGDVGERPHAIPRTVKEKHAPCGEVLRHGVPRKFAAGRLRHLFARAPAIEDNVLERITVAGDIVAECQVVHILDARGPADPVDGIAAAVEPVPDAPDIGIAEGALLGFEEERRVRHAVPFELREIHAVPVKDHIIEHLVRRPRELNAVRVGERTALSAEGQVTMLDPQVLPRFEMVGTDIVDIAMRKRHVVPAVERVGRDARPLDI